MTSPSANRAQSNALPHRLGVVILAGGQSVRMGRPKLLLPWGGTSVVGHLIEQWKALGSEQIAVVCAAQDSNLVAELDRLGFPMENRIYNPEPERGMFSSVQCAACWPDWNADLSHWSLVLGDQPHLRLETLRALLEFSAARPNQVCQPERQGHPRHPVFLPKAAFIQLAASLSANLKDFLAACKRSFCSLDDPGLDLDIDRPEDYEQALRLNRGRAALSPTRR